MLSFKFNLNNVAIILITILITFWVGYLSYKAFEEPQTKVTPTPAVYEETQIYKKDRPLLNHDTPLAKRDIRLYEPTRGHYDIQFINDNEVKYSEPYGANDTSIFSSIFYTFEDNKYGLAIRYGKDHLPEIVGYNFTSDTPLIFSSNDADIIKQFTKSVISEYGEPSVDLLKGTSQESLYFLESGFFTALTLDHYPIYKLKVNDNLIEVEKVIDFGKAFLIKMPTQLPNLKNLPPDINSADYFVVTRGKFTPYQARYYAEPGTIVDESWDELVKVTANGKVIKIRNLTDAERKYSED